MRFLQEQVRPYVASFDFKDDRLEFMFSNECVQEGFNVLYSEISFAEEEGLLPTSGRSWWRFLGCFSALLCIALLASLADMTRLDASLPVLQAMQEAFRDGLSLREALWLSFWGGFWSLVVLTTVLFAVVTGGGNPRVTALATDRGDDIIVFHGPQKEDILKEIAGRRNAAAKRFYGVVNPFNELAAERDRLLFLQRNGVLTDAEYEALLARLMIRAPAQARENDDA